MKFYSNSLKKFAFGLLLAAGLTNAFATFRVVGYMPSWQGSVSSIQFSKVTHINYAFLLPNSNGSLQAIDNASKLTSLVTSAHNAGVKVSISVGGWNDGNDSAFVSLAGNSTSRTAFVNNIVNFINQYNLDGVDIDWEYPDTSSESANYTTLMSQLASAMHSRGKTLTAAVVAYGSTGDFISSSVFSSVDWLNIMDYDNTNGTGQSTYNSAITALDYWNTTRGLPASKAQLGVPFYSDPSDFAFWDLLNKGADPFADSWGSEGYNGITTIQKKTNLAFDRSIGGIMFWELSQDATGQYSLLSAIYTVIQQRSGGSLPTGWTDADVGPVGVAGNASYSSGTFTLNGSGSDIWGTNDAFNFAYRSTNGDVTVVARVASQESTASWAKAGVMFRDSTAANAAYAAVYVTPSNGVSMQVRQANGATAVDLGRQAGLDAPYWVKIVRSGSTFTGYSSPDGTTWALVGATNITMAATAKAGLADCAHANTTLNTSTFDNVSFTTVAPPDFSLSASPTSVSIVQGTSGTTTITETDLNGFTGSVSLSASGLPAGVTATFNPASTTNTSTLTLTASGSATTGTVTVTITGTSGSLTHTTSITLTVTAAPNFSLSASPSSLTVAQGSSGSSTISVGSLNGFSGTVDLTVSGLPSGITAGLNPPSVVAPGTSILTVTVDSSAAVGTVTVTVTGTSGSLTHSVTLTLTVTPPPDFSLSVSPGNVTVVQGGSASCTVTENDLNGFNGSVTLSASGLPSGITATFNPTSTTNTSTLTFTASSTAALGTSTVTITGASGSLVHSITMTLTVNPAPDFSLSASPASVTITQGASGASTITENDLNGFNGSVALSASGLPSGVTAAFNPASTTNTSTLTLTASSTAATGTFTVTITGTNGSLSHTTTVTLTVNHTTTLSFEAEAVSYVTNGATATLNTDTNASGGQWILFNGTASGQYIEYTLPNVPAGTYDLTLLYKQNTTRGIVSLTVDGVKLDGDLDQYGASLYTQKDFGLITFMTLGNHKVRLTLTGKNASSTGFTGSADAFKLTPASQAWLHGDIGAVGVAGSFSQNSGTYTVAGSGSDIWTTGDQFHYAWQNVSGDVAVTARVASEQQTSGFAKAGVMIRASLATNSVEASVLLTPTNGVAMEIRPTTGASSINVSGWVKGPVPPQYVKLSRTGNTFTASYSADGASWTQIATTNVTMSVGATAGMAVTSHNNAALNTATFDNVGVQ